MKVITTYKRVEAPIEEIIIKLTPLEAAFLKRILETIPARVMITSMERISTLTKGQITEQLAKQTIDKIISLSLEIKDYEYLLKEI